ncbi:MAG: PAS domain-containing protein [Desulfobacterales bacterium]|nr:PAS domain-containing protein [Desulfobacterales bacterium]
MAEKPTFPEFEQRDLPDESQFTDVTECKSGALDKGKDKVRSLYQEAPLAYFRVGMDGTIDDCNKMAEQLSGYSMEEVHGKNMRELFAEAPESGGKSEAIFDRILQDDTVHNERVRMVKKDGLPTWASLSAKAIKDSDGKTTKVLLMIRLPVSRK